MVGRYTHWIHIDTHIEFIGHYRYSITSNINIQLKICKPRNNRVDDIDKEEGVYEPSQSKLISLVYFDVHEHPDAPFSSYVHWTFVLLADKGLSWI